MQPRGKIVVASQHYPPWARDYLPATADELETQASAWLRAIGRLRPGALTAGVAPRLTATLRDWMPLVFVAVVFDNLENYTGLVRPTTIDATPIHDADPANSTRRPARI